jgi:superfamily II DNA or RNA helicase
VREPKRELRDYQSKAIKNWEQNGCRGIISFATGGGKTLTAIHAIKKWRESGKPTLVLVPSVLLHGQWIREITEEIPDVVIIKFGANNPVTSREQILREATSSSNAVVVATYATAATDKFMSSCNFSPRLLVVADEVHTAGQPEFRRFLHQDFEGPRLGLSATPSRYGDPEGSLAISDFFGPIIEPKFGLREAIESGALVPYDYDYVKTELSDTEFAEWENLSKRISSLSARAAEGGDPDNYLKLLLLKRARIAKSASSKAKHAKETIQNNFVAGDRWLIYCSDTTQLGLVRSELSSLSIPLLEYHQKMQGDRETTLDYFGEEGGLLLAIKCLDEGVDIPNINKALILASSTNPREYIQRRGRVLRKSPGKYSAAIWDTLVVNPSGELLTVAEAHRALMFSETSTTIATQIRLKSDIDSSGFGIDLDSSEIEDEETNEE